MDDGQATHNIAILEEKVWHDVPNPEQSTEHGHQSPALLGPLLSCEDRAIESVDGDPGACEFLEPRRAADVIDVAVCEDDVTQVGS